MMFIAFSCASAWGGTSSIGTVSAGGYIRVDGYKVLGNGTLFEGTAVETAKATATLRLDNGAEIFLSANSSGVVRHDRFELMQGQCQLKASSSPFFIEAAHLNVTPGEPNSLGVVSLNPANSVDKPESNGGQIVLNLNDVTLVVSAITGEFQVSNNAGLSVGQVSQVSQTRGASSLGKAAPVGPTNPGSPPPQSPLLPPASH
jgi:hypothetical protein